MRLDFLAGEEVSTLATPEGWGVSVIVVMVSDDHSASRGNYPSEPLFV
ncbi:hypothetical protein [Streptomyces canus]|nr:hypothetical protein [Streptomyces canus]MDQ0765453.1 hypothetical protein [Streptomyces canus]